MGRHTKNYGINLKERNIKNFVMKYNKDVPMVICKILQK